MEYSEYKSAVINGLPAESVKKLPDINTLLQLWFRAGITVQESKKRLLNEKETTRKTKNKRPGKESYCFDSFIGKKGTLQSARKSK